MSFWFRLGIWVAGMLLGLFLCGVLVTFGPVGVAIASLALFVRLFSFIWRSRELRGQCPICNVENEVPRVIRSFDCVGCRQQVKVRALQFVAARAR